MDSLLLLADETYDRLFHLVHGNGDVRYSHYGRRYYINIKWEATDLQQRARCTSDDSDDWVYT